MQLPMSPSQSQARRGDATTVRGVGDTRGGTVADETSRVEEEKPWRPVHGRVTGRHDASRAVGSF